MVPPTTPNRRDESAVWSIFGSLLAGIVVWGGVGYGLDRLLGTSFLVLVGVIVGAAAAVYLAYVRSLT